MESPPRDRKVREAALFGLFLFTFAVITILHACQSYDRSASGVGYTVVATGLAGPRGLFFAPSGELYMVEQSSGDITQMVPDGRLTRIAKGLSNPHDLTMDAEGNLYVAETGANRVARISPQGVVTTYIAGLATPVDLDFNPRGELVVCELRGDRVTAFKSPEAVRVVVSGFAPHGLAFGPSGVTFVND